MYSSAPYTLNVQKAREKLEEAANRIPMKIEEKNGNAIVEFNAGVFGAVVVSAINNLKSIEAIEVEGALMDLTVDEKSENSDRNVETIIKCQS